jgi:ferric-dicitrate binding protein FerR (iron transport regulator)
VSDLKTPASDEWYSNKDLFEFFNALRREFDNLKSEMQQTREVIRRYNGLREELAQVKADVQTMKDEARGRGSVGRAIREWGGWITAILAASAAFLKLYQGG